ncbi:fatty acid cis/trans isomerase [Aestuariicella hydrocarbonica]|uniref:Fatty acid cis/trans isomerase n=1 Tax=Pseudomaricurvus hydrocarbonicus TaxID=1470433 RepID=A0A9E5JV62_9GAMM|nr:fatty acid cis/trans isomerase [Aestuariicella hydrocarbonica]
MKKSRFLMLVVFVTGCTTFGAKKLSELYGPAQPGDREVKVLETGQIDYWNDVKPVIENRCVVCHSCYDAPCQLKLGSIEGIERGASKDSVYDQSRLFKADLTRLFEDAGSVSEWRAKGFHPVLNEQDETFTANKAAGVMHQLLQLKSNNPLPDANILSDDFTFGLNRKNECPKPEEITSYSNRNPLWGMPYALPGLKSNEQQLLLRWLEQGAVHTKRPALPSQFKSLITEWETFFNQSSLRGQLVNRYIYEHLFLASLYFDELEGRHFFRLVRSRTAPGQPVDIIATRRPYDDPAVERVYYRLVESKGVVVAKTHMPYALNKKRMIRWNSLFYDRDYTVDQLPDYDLKHSSNPFLTFKQLPVSSRYQFILDEAQYTVMGFIKGPVCRGQVALNVINDHFWVFFIKPSELQDTALTEFIADNGDLLSLPSGKDSIYRPLSAWRTYSKKQRNYLAKRDEYLLSLGHEKVPLDLSQLWDGNGSNENAALTVFRHYDSATVEKGLLGMQPKTAWLLGYMDLERIHYLLVAGYDVYGNVGHQLLSRLYMDFLRMESEGTFLLLLPQESRKKERALWYRGANEEVLAYLESPEVERANHNTAISYNTDNPKQELFKMLMNKYKYLLPKYRKLSSLKNEDLARTLGSVSSIKGDDLNNLPQNSIILVETKDGDEFFTLIKNNAHLNMTSMFGEQKKRIPSEDQLIILRGFVGSYPNLFFKINDNNLVDFIKRISASGTEQGFSELMNRYAVRRSHPDFWVFSDRVYRGYENFEPVDFGLLDYNRLENR